MKIISLTTYIAGFAPPGFPQGGPGGPRKFDPQPVVVSTYTNSYAAGGFQPPPGFQPPGQGRGYPPPGFGGR